MLEKIFYERKRFVVPSWAVNKRREGLPRRQPSLFVFIGSGMGACLHFFLCLITASMLAWAQAVKSRMMGSSERPKSVSRYSTFGGTTG